MKKNVIILVFAIFSLFIISCKQGTSRVNNPIEKAKAEKVVYTCEMHPEVITDKPGQCPKCGMELIKKVVSAETDTVKTQMTN